MDLDKGKQSLYESFLKTGDVKRVISSLEYILKNNSPLALYIATLDHSSCSWIFDTETISSMLKSFNTTIEDIKKDIEVSIDFSIPEEDYILFLVFTKINPLMPAIIPREMVEELVEDLRNEP